MATVKRASRYVTYLIAIFITGVFSLFGKPAPAWAQEVKSEQSAKVFNEIMKVAQTNNTRTQVDVSRPVGSAPSAMQSLVKSIPTPGKPLTERKSPYRIINQDVFGPDDRLTPDKQDQLNQQLNDNFQSIRNKVLNDVPLTVEELNLLQSQSNAQVIEDLKSRLQIQDKVIEELKNRLHGE